VPESVPESEVARPEEDPRNQEITPVASSIAMTSAYPSALTSPAPEKSPPVWPATAVVLVERIGSTTTGKAAPWVSTTSPMAPSSTSNEVGSSRPDASQARRPA
jgi:hypothetical protein